MGSKVGKSITIVAFFLMGSKLLGLVRESLVAAKYGSNELTDCYFLASTLVVIISEGLINLIKTTTIPLLNDAFSKGGISRKNSSFTATMVFYLFICTVFYLLILCFSKNIVRLCAFGFTEKQVIITSKLMHIATISTIISVFIGCFRGYLQSENRFTESSMTEIPHNIIIIIYLITLSSAENVSGLMKASVVAFFAQMIIQIPFIKKTGYTLSFPRKKDFYHLNIIAKMAPGILLSGMISDINQLIDKNMASLLPAGVITSFNYAGKIRSIFLGVVISAITTVYFPLLSKAISTKDDKSFDSALMNGTILLMLVSFPFTVCIISLSKYITKVILFRGEFDINSLNITTQILIFYSISIPALALKPFIKNAFFAMKNSFIPLINVIITVAINITLNFLLIHKLKHIGLALSTSVASYVTLVLLLFEISSKRKDYNTRKVIKNLLKILLSSTIMFLSMYLLTPMLSKVLTPYILGDLLIIIISSIIGMIIYLAVSYILKVDELSTLKDRFLSILVKKH